jgi:hypothetical protein
MPFDKDNRICQEEKVEEPVDELWEIVGDLGVGNRFQKY